MRYIGILVVNSQLELFCCLANKHNVRVIKTKDCGDGTFAIKVGTSSDVALFDLGFAFGSYSPTFKLN